MIWKVLPFHTFPVYMPFAVDTYRYLKVNQDENITNYQANRQRRYNKKKGEMML